MKVKTIDNLSHSWNYDMIYSGTIFSGSQVVYVNDYFVHLYLFIHLTKFQLNIDWKENRAKTINLTTLIEIVN